MFDRPSSYRLKFYIEKHVPREIDQFRKLINEDIPRLRRRENVQIIIERIVSVYQMDFVAFRDS